MAESYRPYLLEIAGVLSVSEFHVGSGVRLSLSTDAPVLRDADGRPYLPGSSLRGILRSYLEREGPLLIHDAKRLLGSLFGEVADRSAESKSRAGRLRVFDASPVEDVRLCSEVRDHVKICSKYGAAERGAKFDQEVAGGGDLRFRVAYEGDSAQDEELVLLKDAIRALGCGELSCGAKSGLGYGRLQLSEVRYSGFDRRNTESLATWLNCRIGEAMKPESEFPWPPSRPTDGSKSGGAALQRRHRLDLKLTLHFDGPALVRAAVPPINPRSAPFDARDRSNDAKKGLVTADRAFIQTGEDGHNYLPAASIRGVLRHQAERITKAVGGGLSADDLFGQVGKGPARKGLIEVTSGKLVSDRGPVYLDHVAIDRITGFAADAKKFAWSALQSPCFETTIRIRFHEKQLHLVALAGFVLRDLMDGMLWCGGGTSRGYGYMKRATIQKATLDWASGSDIPKDFMTEERSEERGRTILSGTAIPFDSWFWQEAEKAWLTALAAGADEGGQ